MPALLAVITPIALFDMLSVLPVNSVLLLTQAHGSHPLRNALMFVGGFYTAGYVGGLLVAFGLQWIFDLIPVILRDFLLSRSMVAFGLQLLLGIAMIVTSERLQFRGAAAEKSPDPGLESGRDGTLENTRHSGWLRSFSLGFGVSAAGLPSGLTYFVAIDQMVKANTGLLPVVFLLAYYNLIVIGPLLMLAYIAWRSPDRSQQIVERIGRFSSRWTPRVVRTVLMTIGGILAIDAMLFFGFGQPLIPMS